MKKLRNSTIILILAGLFLWGLHLFLFDFVIPKTTVLAIPAKWRMLPLKQSKEIVHDYLGAPLQTKTNVAGTHDEWLLGSSDKQYTLHIYYFEDSIAVTYSIRYHYENFHLSRNYLLDSVSIR